MHMVNMIIYIIYSKNKKVHIKVAYFSSVLGINTGFEVGFIFEFPYQAKILTRKIQKPN